MWTISPLAKQGAWVKVVRRQCCGDGNEQWVIDEVHVVQKLMVVTR